MLTGEECSETVPYKHLSNHVFRKQQFRQNISYGAHLFFQNFQNFNVNFATPMKILQNVFRFLDNCI